MSLLSAALSSSRPRHSTRAAFSEWRLLTLLLVLAGALLGHARGLGRPDQTLYDAALNLMPRAPSPAIVIVAIDDKSLAEIGRWPWPRTVHAALLDKLAATAPKAIGLDLILSEPEPASAASPGDGALERALRHAGRVVLPVTTQPRGQDASHGWRAALPVPLLTAAAAALGHIHMEIDQDGIARSVFLREGLGSADAAAHGAAAGWPHFALALHDLGAGAPLAALPGERNPRAGDAPEPDLWLRDYWMQIPFAGPPGTFAQVSYTDVLKGAVPAGRFAGKYVLVGATAAGLSDSFPTPVSGQSRPMPGIEISANVLAALLEDRAMVRAGAWANSGFCVAPVLLLMIGLLMLSPRRGLMLAGVLIAATLAAAFLALRFAGVWFAPGAALACLILAYPLWSWRRLEATVRYLGDEFIRLDAEPRILPADQPGGGGAGADLVEKRILAVAAAAERLRHARRFVSDTLESLPDATLVADSGGAVLLANRGAASLFQAPSAAALRGRPVAALIAGLTANSTDAPVLTWERLQAPAAAEPSQATDPGASPPTAEAAVLELATDGGANLLVRCAACLDGAGAAIGAIVSLIDISPLRSAERRREEVLAFLSHDMRSPQSSILALLELHELDPEDNPADTVHQRIGQYARRTLELSEQFLQLARAETKEYEFETVDLGPITEEAIEEAWAAAEQKHITLELSFDGEPVPVKADPALLRRALINLLTNAVKYSPDNTTVSIAVDSRDGWQTCRVADQGYGIGAEDLKQLFGRFRRFAAPGQPKATGAGLGMSFVKTVVDKHGGQIEVESTLGEGSTFTIRLPPAPA